MICRPRFQSTTLRHPVFRCGRIVQMARYRFEGAKCIEMIRCSHLPGREGPGPMDPPSQRPIASSTERRCLTRNEGLGGAGFDVGFAPTGNPASRFLLSSAGQCPRCLWNRDRPPSTTTSAPVVNEESSLARNRAVFAISTASPKRFSGTCASIAAAVSDSCASGRPSSPWQPCFAASFESPSRGRWRELLCVPGASTMAFRRTEDK